MSLHLEFEPHSWYMGWAIKKNTDRWQPHYKGDPSSYPSYKTEGEARAAMEREGVTSEDWLTEWTSPRGIEPTIEVIQTPGWSAYTANGMTGYVEESHADTLESLRAQIRDYHLSQHNGYGERIAKRRLEQIRASLDTREPDAYANDREVYIQKLQAREAIRDSITIMVIVAIAAWPVGKMLLSLLD